MQRRLFLMQKELDKLLASMSEEEIAKLAKENQRRYMRRYHAKKEIEWQLKQAGEKDATV